MYWIYKQNRCEFVQKLCVVRMENKKGVGTPILMSRLQFNISIMHVADTAPKSGRASSAIRSLAARSVYLFDLLPVASGLFCFYCGTPLTSDAVRTEWKY